MSSPLQRILKINWVLIPTRKTRFGLKPNLEKHVRKSQNLRLCVIIKLFAAASNQVRLQLKLIEILPVEFWP